MNFKFPIDKNGRVNFALTLIAKRRSGKSEMIKYLYNTYLSDKYDYVMVYSTAMNNEFYKEFITGRKSFIDMDGEGGLNLSGIQAVKDANDKARKNTRIINTLVIFDDTNSRKQKFDNTITQIYLQGRHYNISIIYASQVPTLVDNTWKENTDYLILFKMKTARYRKYVIENILAGTLDIVYEKNSEELAFYRRLFMTCSKEKYTACVVDLTSDRIFAFKVPYDDIKNNN